MTSPAACHSLMLALKGSPREVILAFSRLSAKSMGILLYLCGMFFFAVNDAIGKWLVADYAVSQVLLLRTIGALPVLALIGWQERRMLLHRRQLGLNLLRVVCMAVDTYAFYYATISLPLVEVMTFYMAAPLIVTALSGPVLGEQVGLQRWSVVIIGFIGVLIALEPSSAGFSPAALVALFGAFMFAMGVTTTRKLRGTHWLPLVAWQFGFAGLVGAATSAPVWVTPDLTDLSLLFLIGIVSMLCFVAVTKALALAPASLLAPFQYSSVLWGASLGWAVWGDVPTPAIVIGNAIIIGSGLYLVRAEHRRDSLPLPAEARP